MVIKQNKSCALCGLSTKLSKSHILPKFVTAKMKEISLTGKIGSVHKEYMNYQNGIKTNLLCPTCDNKFSPFENIFKKKIFDPFHNNGLKEIKYGEWLYKFIVSISWRVLKFYENDLTNKDEYHDAMKIWSDYLLHNIKDNLDNYNHYILFLPLSIEKNSNFNTKNINIYIQRYNDFLSMNTPDGVLFVFTKMLRILTFSVLNIPDINLNNRRIDKDKGILFVNTNSLNDDLLKLLDCRAKRIWDDLPKLTEQQEYRNLRKVVELIQTDPDKFIEKQKYFTEYG